MKPSNEIWPPSPARPEPEADTDDGNWPTANDLTYPVTWREYAVVVFAVFWGLSACFAAASHHHPLRDVKHILHTVQTVLP